MLFLQYLGYEEVKEARGVKVCSAAVAKLIKDKKNVSTFYFYRMYDVHCTVHMHNSTLALVYALIVLVLCNPSNANGY